MADYYRKYGVATAAGTHIGLQMVKAGAADFAVSADWTPATGDVQISIDGGGLANITTLPAYLNGFWIFQFTLTELTGKSIRVLIVDAATKAVEDNYFVIETTGNASAAHPFDIDSVNVTATLTSGERSTLATAILTDTTDTLGADIVAIKAKTDNLPASPAAVGSAMTLTSGERSSIATAVLTDTADTLGADIVAIKAKTDNLPASPAAVGSAMTLSSGERSTLATVILSDTTDTLGADIVAIKAKTDNLPGSPAATGAAMTLTSGERTTLAGVILADTTDLLGADIVAIKAKTDNLPANPAAVGSAMALTSGERTTLAGVIIGDTTDTLGVAILAIKAKTDNLPASPAAVGSAMTLTSPERNAVADAYLDRADAIESGETPRQFYRKSRAFAFGLTTVNTTLGTVDFMRKDGVTTSFTITHDTSGNRTAYVEGTN